MAAALNQWQVVKQVLSGALEHDPSDRSAYLDRVCTTPSLRQEVESLIAASATADSGFLQAPAAERLGIEPVVKLGSYEITDSLAAGGMGVVYKARDTKLPRNVAIKILPPNFASDSDAIERFRREANALASLSHPNIVTIYEIGEEGHTLYIAMELVDGKILSDVLSAGRMRMEEVLDVATQIANGLAFAHRSRIVHRDLKPKNIMIRSDGIVKILDFGLSKLAPDASRPLMEQSTELTGPATILGTVDYMSPQQAAGLPVDSRSDQFSFGSLVYEMATGKRPFARNTAAQTLAAIIEDQPTPAKSLNAKIPSALDAVIRRCLRKNPDERYASTDDLARELTDQREQFSGSRQARFPRWALAAALVLMLSLAAAGIWTIAPRLSHSRAWSFLVHQAREEQIAVLPFTNVGNDPANQAFCDGLVEILTSKLSQLQQFQRTLRVVPATDVLQEGIVSVREARRTFGVNLVITGSVQRLQDEVRMTINLVDPRQVRQLKSKTIDTKVQDISTLQDGVVLETAQLLDVPLTRQAKQMLASGGTTVPDAYDLYAQGKGYLQRYEVAENLDAAISLFKRALEKDPKYALAEAGLGEAYWKKYELTKDTQWVDAARRSSETALKLNDKLPEVFISLAMIDSGTGRDKDAIQNLQKALAMEPLNPDVYQGLASAYQGMGRIHDAESTYLRAIAVRPTYWGFHNDLGALYFRLGRYADAEKQFQSIVELTPDNTRGYNNLGAVALAQRRYEDAAKLFERANGIKPTEDALSNLGTIYYTQGRYSLAAQYYEKAIRLNSDDALYWHNLAAAYEWSNQPDKARAAFRRTAETAQQELRVNPKDTAVIMLLADAYSMLNENQRAKQLLQRGLALAPNDASDMFQASVVYEQLGDRKLALKWLAAAIKGGYPRDVIEREPSLRKLRSDPRYRRLFRP